MNVIAIKGRLTRDPELSSFKNSNGDNRAVCRFSVAVNRDYGDDADFFNCSIFGKRAEVIDKYFSKGMEIVCQGRMEQNKYKDKDGNDRTTWNLIVMSFDFCGKKSDNGSNEPKADGFEQIEEDVPF